MIGINLTKVKSCTQWVLVVMLTKVQVTELVKYEPKSTNDFDYDDTDVDDETAEKAETHAKMVAAKKAPAAAPVKKGPGRPKKVVEDDDEIPF